MADPIRILVVDDHPVVRDGLVAMLSTQPDFKVVSEASNGQEAVQNAQRYHPDIVLLDLEMPEIDGVEALRQMRAQNPGLRALVFTAFDTDERILGALQAGAQGYLLQRRAARRAVHTPSAWCMRVGRCSSRWSPQGCSGMSAPGRTTNSPRSQR